jgi:hypothetical protein
MTNVPVTTPAYVPSPYLGTSPLADFSQLMPGDAFDGLINATGIRLGWLKGAQCPCTYSGSTPGAAKPNCLTCLGRGVYWNKPLLICNSIVTFMHTSSAPDEPGFHMHDKMGPLRRTEPTITIPANGPNNETTVYNESGPYDAFVELDGAQRLSATLVSGTQEILPYQQGIILESVTTYDAVNNVVQPVASNQYTQYAAQVTLDPTIFPIGTPYVVEFTALPVWVAFRNAGGEAHNRPFGLTSSSGLPKRYHVVALDAWTRAVFNGETPQGNPIVSANGIPEPIIPGVTIQFDGWA